MLNTFELVLEVRPMKDQSEQGVLDRLLLASNSSSEAALAARLGITSQAVYNAKNKGQIPTNWVFDIAKTFGVSTDWLFWGTGPMRRSDETGETQNAVPKIGIAAFMEREAETKKDEVINKLITSYIEVTQSEIATLKSQLQKEVIANAELSVKNAELSVENAELKQRLSLSLSATDKSAHNGAA